MNKYSTELLNNASKLDAATDSCGEIIKLAVSIVEDSSRAATISLLKKISEVVDNQHYKIEIKQIAQILNLCLIEYFGYDALQNIYNSSTDNPNDSRSLSDLLHELNALIGLESVKEKINDLIAYQKVQSLREQQGLHSQKGTLHMAFTGNPGTGKTTVARIVGHIYKQIGLLSKGHFIEVSRTDLIAGYQGQTAIKVKNVIEKSKGGVLFIDEAYSITENEHSDSYGRECLTELTKALEDYREDLVVIVAGYTNPMKVFFESNPGLKSRFNTFIEFEDYSSEELMKILLSLCNKNDYYLGKETETKIREFFTEIITNKDDNFSNGRFVRNVFDDLVLHHAKRIANLQTFNRDILSLLTSDDFVLDKTQLQKSEE